MVNQVKVSIVIDAFRAFATASYVLQQRPASYMLATKCSVICQLASEYPNPLLIGKPGIGSGLIYDIPNSPTRVQEIKMQGRHIIHRTEAGAKGILLAKDADIILAAGFVNAEATADYIKKLENPQIKIIPMGHEGVNPTLEDDLCAHYIGSLIAGKKISLTSFVPDLKKGPGRYFFTDDQWQYPQEDFARCIQTAAFNFAIQAVLKEDYALLCLIT